MLNDTLTLVTRLGAELRHLNRSVPQARTLHAVPAPMDGTTKVILMETIMVSL